MYLLLNVLVVSVFILTIEGFKFKITSSLKSRCCMTSTSTNKIQEQYLALQRANQLQLQEERIQRAYHLHLDALANGDEKAIEAIGNIETWRKYATPDITISQQGYQLETSLYTDANNIMNDTYLAQTQETLDYRGFAILDPNSFEWSTYDVNFTSLATTMDNLVNAGYPPVFIFLYDQPWKMCLRLFDAMCPILNDKEATLEASMHAWALQKQPKNQFIKEKVGGNFGVPHRDITYKNCHSIDGSPDILSLWIPLVDVSTDNGCMMVIPRECDPQFDQDTNPKDQDPFSHKMQYASIKPLSPISAGTTLVWHPNLIHWGAACSYSSELPPRKSIAMAFRVRDSKRESTPKEIDRYGRIPFTRSELLAGGPDFKARLRMIVKSLMLYNVWYPKYEGLEIEKIAS